MKISGDWYMVVMDDISDEYEELDGVWYSIANEIYHRSSRKGEGAGFVHVDVWRVNIMVKKNEEAGIHLIDFDWAGRIRTTTYPKNMKCRFRFTHVR